MPNVMLYGYQPMMARKLRTEIEVVMCVLNIGGEAVTTIVNAEVRHCGDTNDPAPYLRLCTTDADEAARIKTAFADHDLLRRQDLEVVGILEFIPGVKPE